MRYRIDHYDSAAFPFGLYREVEQRGYWGPKTGWEYVNSFALIEDARKFYEKIKDLPEYLGGAK